VICNDPGSEAATMPDSEPTGLDANSRLRKCPATAGAYHLLTIVHVFKPHISCLKDSLLVYH
jgi:hypothetical protein